MAEGYNGWANRQTWNVALWIGNEESYYRAAVELVERKKKLGGVRGRITAGTAEKFVKCTLGWDRTPDGDGLSRVRWGEIARMLRELSE